MLEYIYNQEIKNGIQPTYREVGQKLKISANAVLSRLLLCEHKGYVEFTGKWRGIKFTDKYMKEVYK